MNYRLPTATDSLLLVIDIQEKLAAAMPPRYVQGNLTRAGKVVKAAQRLNVPTLVTEQYKKGLGATLPVVARELAAGVTPIEKLSFSCCNCDGFNVAIAAWPGPRHAILLGMETHICVMQTALDLRDHGYAVSVIEDCCLSRYDQDHIGAVQQLRASGVGVITFETLLYAWIKQAATPEFKDISYLSRERDE